MSNAGSVAIIGGADGPTAIYVTGDPFGLTLACVAIAIAVVLFIIYKTRKRKK